MAVYSGRQQHIAWATRSSCSSIEGRREKLPVAGGSSVTRKAPLQTHGGIGVPVHEQYAAASREIESYLAGALAETAPPMWIP